MLNQLQGRIFGVLYLHDRPLSLDEIAEDLQQSKSNISVNIRGLVEWHLVRRVRVQGSRKDNYTAATDFWRVMQEIMEKRFRWNMRQVLAAVEEAQRAAAQGKGATKAARERGQFVEARLGALGAFFTAVDAGVAAFTQGRSFEPDILQEVLLGTTAAAKSRKS